MKTSFLPATAGLILMAAVVSGCSVTQIQSKHRSGGQTVTPPTPTPVPTLTVSGGKVAEIVNGQKISLAMYRRFVHAEEEIAVENNQKLAPNAARHITSSQLAEYTLYDQYAKSHSLSVTSKAISTAFKNEVQGSGGTTAFQARMKLLGLLRSDFIYITRINLLQAKIQAQLFPLQASGPIATARYILISPGAKNPCAPGTGLTDAAARGLAQSLVDQIHQGKAFPTLAKKCSEDSATAAHGGILNDAINPSSTLLYHVQGFPPAREHAIFNGPVKQIQMIHDGVYWEVIQVMTRRTGKYPAQESQQAQAREFQAWGAEQVKKANIQTLAKIS